MDKQKSVTQTRRKNVGTYSSGVPDIGLNRQRLQNSYYRPNMFKEFKKTISKELKEHDNKVS